MKYSVDNLYRDELTIDEFFLNVNQVEAWSYILQQPIQIGKYITNPLRNDNLPGCWLRYYQNKKILFVDFGTEFNGNDCLAYFHKAIGKSIPYIEAAKLLYSIVNQGFIYDYQPRFVSSLKVTNITAGVGGDIKYEIFHLAGQPKYQEKDKDYFQPRRITTQQLIEDNVFPIKWYQIDRILTIADTPMYVMKLNGRFKIYMPFAKDKRKRFVGNVVKDDVWIWRNDKDLWTENCIITKAWKDGREIFNTLGIDTFAFQNEGVLPKLLSEIESNYYKKLIIYDNDSTGRYSADKLSSVLTNSYLSFIPHKVGKDYDDFIIFDFEQAEKWLNDEYARMC